ncbi:unnamed protein product [Durusdinium trenchii]|uniref:Uncharacterized protein n=1 Tax=Durusdinium trenchii TaxID=1381693 RepID=A0ABP0QVC6_9DINO
MRPFCCSLADLEEACEEVGLHPTVAASEPEEVAPALQGLLQRGALQPLLDEHCWNALVGAKKLSSKQEMLGRRLDGRLRGLCSTINGVGMSRPRSPVDSLFFLVTVEHMVRVCNRLCCSLELTPIGASDKDAPGTVRLLPGEDADCPDLDSMQLELLLPRSDARVAMARSKSSSFRASVTSMAEEENEMLEEEEEESPSLPERYVLQRPQRLLEPGGAMTAGGPVRSQQSLLGRNKAPCCFKGKGDKLVEVQVQKEEGVVQEHCYWPGLHCTQFGSHTSQLTLFVSHWLVNRQNAPVVIPHPRSVGLSRSRHVVDEPMMVIPGHGLRPLSQHALADGSLEIGLRAPEASEAPGHTPSNARPSLQRTVRRRKTLFASQKGSKTGSIKVDRPRKGGVLPFLAVEDGPDSLCLGFSVNQAPFPFYRTLVVEVTRRYTLVNLKNHRLWVSDGHNYLHLMPGKPQAYHPHGGDAEFHLDISGVGPKEFTAGFRLSQLFKLAGDDTGRRGKLQLMYMVSSEEQRSSTQSLASLDSSKAFSGTRWGLLVVEALEVSSALILRFLDPPKPQFRMVNRARSSVCFRQDHPSAPLFYLPPEGVLNFAWYSPPSFRTAAPENVSSSAPALLLGAVVDEVVSEEELYRVPTHRYDIAQVREHQHLEFPQSQSHSFTFRANSRMSGAVSKRVSRVTRRMTSMITMQHKPPDLYKVRTSVHQGSLEVHIFPWVRVSNETKWPVTVRADSSDAGQTIDLEEEVDLWPSSKNEMLFQMKRSGVDAKGNSFEWSQPLTLSESMTTYRGFFRQRCGGEADTVEVSVARDELSGFLRLTLSACKQDPFLIENKSSEKCRFAPKNATGWVMHLQKGDGECPFFSHLWGGDTWMTLTLSARGESHESFDFDLAVPHTHHFRDLIIEVGKVKDKPKLVVVRDTTEKQTKSLTRRSIRERGVLGTLNRMSVAFRADHLAPALELGVQKLQSLASQNGKNEMKTVKSHVTFATDEDQEEEQPQHRLFTMGSGNHLNPMKSLESLNLQPRRFIEWMTMTSSLTSMPTLRPRRCLCFRCFGRKEKAVEPLRRKKAVRMKPARSNLMGQEIDELDWSLDLRLEGLGVAMLEMQLDTRESHELGYGSLKGLTVQLRQVAAKTDVDGRGGSLWVDLKLRSAHLDVGTGDLKHQSKACHSVLRPFTGPLQILSEDGEPPAILHLEAMLKLITENQEVAPRLTEPQAATGPSRNGSAHYEVRRFELKVQPLGLHIETALVSEVVLWVLELSSVLKSGTQRQESHMQHLANALDAEENNAEPNVALADLRFCEPRCVTDPTAEDFQDRTPVVIRELLLRRICCVMTLSFTGTGSWRSDRDEELQALEMLLRLTLPLDVHQARLMLGKLVFGWRGWSVKDFTAPWLEGVLGWRPGGNAVGRKRESAVGGRCRLMCADDYVQSTPEQIRQALQRQKARAEELRRQKAKELKQKVQLVYPAHASVLGWAFVETEQDWQKTKHFLESHQFSDDLNAPKCSCFGFKRSYPLHEAAREGNWEMIMLLMKFGADPQKRDHKGKCASSYASQSKARRVS